MIGRYDRFVRYAPRLLWKRGAWPLYLIFFVTSRCNARCAHCFNWRRADAGADELTLDEYRLISERMPDPVFMFFSGGEPFLRDDLAEIVTLFHRNNHVQKIQTPSNGSLTEAMRRQVGEILTSCPDLHYSVTLSVDAVGEAHDRIRGFPGLFERVMESHRALRELARRHPNFGINFEITVTASNQDTVLDTYCFLRDECEADNVFSVLVRGEPRDPSALAVDLPTYRELNRHIEYDIVRGAARGYFGFPFSTVMNAKNLYSRQVVERIARDGDVRLPCYAGTLAGNVFDNGDVYPCELLDHPMGNLRNCDYDLKKIWRSPEAEAARRHIRQTRCTCTHECFLNTNLLFSVRSLPPILARWIRIKSRGRLC